MREAEGVEAARVRGPNFSPARTGSASWSVRLSFWVGACSSTDGQRIALPRCGWKVMGPLGRDVKRVPPPPSTSFMYPNNLRWDAACGQGVRAVSVPVPGQGGRTWAHV